MDILIGNIITQVIAIDIKAVRKQSDPLLGATLQKLLAKIQSCGVPFQLWKKKDDNSKLDWTSLGGTEKGRSSPSFQHILLTFYLQIAVNVLHNYGRYMQSTTCLHL